MKKNSEAALLIEIEKSVLEAFKNKDDEAFTQYFDKNYIGIARDGIKDAVDEIAGMDRLDIKSLSMTGEQVTFPAKETAIITYTMLVEAKNKGKKLSSSIYSSSVYIKKGGHWFTVLHTETMAKA